MKFDVKADVEEARKIGYVGKTDGEIETMRWPTKIMEWEMKHGIYREVINGVVYIRAANFDRTNASIDRENAQLAAEERRKKAAQRAMEAHERMMSGGDAR